MEILPPTSYTIRPQAHGALPAHSPHATPTRQPYWPTAKSWSPGAMMVLLTSPAALSFTTLPWGVGAAPSASTHRDSYTPRRYSKTGRCWSWEDTTEREPSFGAPSYMTPAAFQPATR